MKKWMRLMIGSTFVLGTVLILNLNSTPAQAEEFDGAQLFKKNCKKCHGKEGEGKKSKRDPSKYQYNPVIDKSAEELTKALKEYREKHNSGEKLEKDEKKMAKAAGKLKTDAEIEAIVKFIGTLKK